MAFSSCRSESLPCILEPTIAPGIEAALPMKQQTPIDASGQVSDDRCNAEPEADDEVVATRGVALPRCAG